ncbi:MAG TPA: nitroreductase family protein [Phycisphaerae bacterium]|nr:nitroreductase family protein [Phycisphaerae bacterium]
MDLDEFHGLTLARRAVRNFKPDPLPEGMLDRLLEAARWAPSGYNLQPTHFVTVSDPALKPGLRVACMNQKQIEQAPATVLFLGDRRVATNNFRMMLAHEEEAGSLHPKYRATLEKFVPLAFHTGPVGLGWIWKATLPPMMRLGVPTPELPAIHRRYWLAKQVSLSAMVFMLAATAAGLGTCPMEGFDEARVKRLLKIPGHMVVVMVIPVGYSADGPQKRTRLPLEKLIHRNGW